MKYLFCLFLLVIGGYANAHQFTPTYPEFTPSHLQGVLKTDMVLFNGRSDVEYYEIKVFDEDWNLVPFAMQQRVFPVQHLDRKYLSIYIRESDLVRAEFICSRSKTLKQQITRTVVASRICSKIK